MKHHGGCNCPVAEPALNKSSSYVIAPPAPRRPDAGKPKHVWARGNGSRCVEMASLVEANSKAYHVAKQSSLGRAGIEPCRSSSKLHPWTSVWLDSICQGPFCATILSTTPRMRAAMAGKHKYMGEQSTQHHVPASSSSGSKKRPKQRMLHETGARKEQKLTAKQKARSHAVKSGINFCEQSARSSGLEKSLQSNDHAAKVSQGR